MSVLICLLGALSIHAADAPVATVNGKTLATRDLEFLALLRGADLQNRSQRELLVQQLIDRHLIRQFLDKRKIVPNDAAIELQLQLLEEVIRKHEKEPQEVFTKIGLTPEQVRQELGLSLAWQVYVEQTVTPEQIRAQFEKHRSELDGTRVHVWHLFRKAATDAEAIDAEALLKTVRRDVEQKRTTFAAAVKQHSQSPSAETGGDVGWIVGRGKLPDEVTTAALSLKPGDLAGPVRSPLGVHLVQVTEREPGQLSLEDARPQILTRLADQMWSATLADERARTKIVLPK